MMNDDETSKSVVGVPLVSRVEAALESPCRWCKSGGCTRDTSPHCYCLDCGAPVVPCRCRPGCPGGNCYRPSCCNRPVATANPTITANFEERKCSRLAER